MIRKENPIRNGYPKIRVGVGVGEIDTSAPFQSVKDAVNLFGASAFSGQRPAIKVVKSHSVEENVYVRDTQLHLAGKELNRLKEQLRNAENMKAEAGIELEKARRKADDLNQKLKAVNEAKDAAKAQAKRLEEEKNRSLVLNNVDLQKELESEREQYMNVLEELNFAKQELTKTRHDYDECCKEKTGAVKRIEEAENAVKANKERAQELLKEVSGVKETIEQVHQATMKAKHDLAFKAGLEESGKRLKEMKSEFDPELIKLLESKLSGKLSEISSLQMEMGDAKATELENQRTVALEMDSAKESLQRVLEEKSGQCNLVDSLKFELESLKKEHEELREKEAETESEAGNLHVKLRKSKSELEICAVMEGKARGDLEEMMTALNQALSEKESGRKELEKMKMEAEELKKEAEATRASLQEEKKVLANALEEAELAKAAERVALEKIKVLSEITKTTRSSTSESRVKITLSRDEFESLSKKTEESEKLALLKVAAAMAQVEAVRASENEAFKKLEAAEKEREDIKGLTEGELKRAEMAEAAKKAIEGELKRWEEREQKKAAEIVVMEREVSAKNSSIHPKFQKQKSELPIVSKKMEKRRASMSKKVMKPSFSSIFHRKNSQIDSGSPSHLP